jgi:hypothetical protein
MNNECWKTLLMDNILPYLCYTNVKTTMHNKNVFQNTLCETFTFLVHDVHIETCPSHFKFSNLPSQTAVYITKFWLRKKC